ncbi:winged helix-turn-helix domain-containing protein [Stappia sp. WLB 29]|uniref:ATP-binding protein n=1 Tax=Stappia sp. WLB 29 TaxID=2925220 RepID=UPI0020C16E40|nr:winged helix-turn-helix domain-containing protein [Stappia sp. WLB 29]
MIEQNDFTEGEVFSFGPFRMVPAHRSLFRDGVSVRVGTRALDILRTLLERPGQVVAKEELIERVWPEVTVEESNLRVNLAALRKALGDRREDVRYITNVPGRGYCFTAPVVRGRLEQAQPDTSESQTELRKLPAPPASMIGRDQAVDALCELLQSSRFVSIVGAGGMGKTTVAVSVAHRLLRTFPDGVAFVDLGAISDPALVISETGAALGFKAQGDGAMARLLTSLKAKRILLVLDNCEHLVQAVSDLSERLIADLPALHLLATSREALRVRGENVYRLAALDVPGRDQGLTAAQALATPAVRLFMERAAASGYSKGLTDEDAPLVARICHRLDGIPLAIELVASRVGPYGIHGVEDLLNNRFRLVWQGRRTALPRHKTLKAMLDWSYFLLSEREQRLLRRLSLFVGMFTHAEAHDFGSTVDRDGDDEGIEAIEGLVEKSLVWVVQQNGVPAFRLPETTRSYAAFKLEECGESERLHKGHVLYVSGLLGQILADAPVIADKRQLTAFEPHLANLRSALAWCFSAGGDSRLGVEMAGQAAPLFLGLSYLPECLQWCGRALAVLPAAVRGSKLELTLQLSTAIATVFTSGNNDEIRHAMDRGLELAGALRDTERQLHLLAGQSVFFARHSRTDEAIRAARHSVTIAEQLAGDSPAVAAKWLLASAHFVAGNQREAEQVGESALAQSNATISQDYTLFGYHQRSRGLVSLALTLWMRGRPERAMLIARQSAGEAETRGGPVDLCLSLTHTVPIFLLSGELDAAETQVGRALSLSRAHSLKHFESTCVGFKGELLIARGNPTSGVEVLKDALPRIRAEGARPRATAAELALVKGLLCLGEVDGARILVAQAREAADRGFLYPEVLRASAEVLMAAQDGGTDMAEALLREAIQLAQLQHALGWELRAATTLAELLLQDGRISEARSVLSEPRSRFREGFATRDFSAAVRMLEKIVTSENSFT